MSECRDFVLSYFINSLWLVPCVVFIGSQIARRLSIGDTGLRHRFLVSTLFIAVLAPVTAMTHFPQRVGSFVISSHTDVGVQDVTRTYSSLSGWRVFRHPQRGAPIAPILGTNFIVFYACFLLWRTFQLLRMLLRTKAMLGQAEPISPANNVLSCISSLEARFRTNKLSVRQSPLVTSPVVAGWDESILLVPVRFFSDTPQKEIQAALAHEFAHVHRKDFTRNVLYEVVTIPIAYHPGTKILKRQLDETRELLCDEIAASVIGSSRAYAQSLLRLAQSLSASPQASSVSLGIFESDNLETRIMTLTATKRLSSRALRRVSAFAGVCVMVALFTTASAFTIQVFGKQNPNLKQFLGTWQARFHGRSFMTIKLENKGHLTGSFSNARISTDADGNLTDAEEQSCCTTLSRATASGDQLHVVGKDTDGSELEFDIKLLSSNEAEVQMIAPPDVKIKPWKVRKVL